MSTNLAKMKFMAKAREAQAKAQESAANSALSAEDIQWVTIPSLAELPVTKECTKKEVIKGITPRISFGGFNEGLENRLKSTRNVKSH
jgi:M-phase phosphoprotein 6